MLPRGSSDAVFCIGDSEDFWVMLEYVSSYLPHAYEFRSGLCALMQLGKEALGELSGAGKSGVALRSALNTAESLYVAGQGRDEQYYQTIGGLGKSRRDLKGAVAQADNY